MSLKFSKFRSKCFILFNRMDSSLTNDLNLNEYIEVFVNVDQTWKTKDAAKSPDIEEQKL